MVTSFLEERGVWENEQPWSRSRQKSDHKPWSRLRCLDFPKKIIETMSFRMHWRRGSEYLMAKIRKCTGNITEDPVWFWLQS